MVRMSIARYLIERRRDPRVNGDFSIENWLRWGCMRLDARGLLIADSWGRVLSCAGFHAEEASELALKPGEDPLYQPQYIQRALFNFQPYIDRLQCDESVKIWPFRFAGGVAYLIGELMKPHEMLYAELEDLCAGFRRISAEAAPMLLAA